MRYWLTYLLCGVVFVMSAQDGTIDSLKLALKNAGHDTTRCNILHTFSDNASEEE